jgi:SPW repeat
METRGRIAAGAGPPIAVAPARGKAASLGWRAEMRGASGSNLLAGVWIAASPWMLEYPAGAVVSNSVATGSLIALLALLRVGAYRASWLSWINALAGAWLTLSAFVVAGSGIALWNSLVFGITVVGLACWSARLSERHTSGSETL